MSEQLNLNTNIQLAENRVYQLTDSGFHVFVNYCFPPFYATNGSNHNALRAMHNLVDSRASTSTIFTGSDIGSGRGLAGR